MVGDGVTQSTVGFLADIAEYMEGISALSLTRGTNLFGHKTFEIETVPADSIILYDDGYEPIPARHVRVLWSVRFVAIRDTRNEALEALRPVSTQLIEQKRFTTPTNSFTILNVTMESSPQLVAERENKRFQAEMTLQFHVLPPFS